MYERQTTTKRTIQPAVRLAVALLLACAASVLTLATGSAQDTLRSAPREARSDERKEAEIVNRPLLIIGSALFVGSYVPSLAFATLGDWEADDALVIPVAGPWLALANPENEPLSKVLLINSGVMQGVGALAMMLSLVIPSYGESTTVRFGKNELQVSPTQVSRDTYGLGAVGSF